MAAERGRRVIRPPSKYLDSDEYWDSSFKKDKSKPQRQIYRLLRKKEVNDSVIGQEIHMYWPDDAQWYRARIEEIFMHDMSAEVFYPGTDTVEHVDLGELINDRHVAVIETRLYSTKLKHDEIPVNPMERATAPYEEDTIENLVEVSDDDDELTPPKSSQEQPKRRNKRSRESSVALDTPSESQGSQKKLATLGGDSNEGISPTSCPGMVPLDALGPSPSKDNIDIQDPDHTEAFKSALIANVLQRSQAPIQTVLKSASAVVSSQTLSRSRSLTTQSGSLNAGGQAGSSAKGLDEVRSRVREQVAAAFDKAAAELRNEGHTEELPQAVELAGEVETELFKMHGFSVSKEYKAKVRTLVFNLKDPSNADLRARVLTGELSPAALVALDAAELAAKQLSEWRKRRQEEVMRMKVLDADTAAMFSTAAAAAAMAAKRAQWRDRNRDRDGTFSPDADTTGEGGPGPGAEVQPPQDISGGDSQHNNTDPSGSTPTRPPAAVPFTLPPVTEAEYSAASPEHVPNFLDVEYDGNAIAHQHHHLHSPHPEASGVVGPYAHHALGQNHAVTLFTQLSPLDHGEMSPPSAALLASPSPTRHVDGSTPRFLGGGGFFGVARLDAFRSPVDHIHLDSKRVGATPESSGSPYSPAAAGGTIAATPTQTVLKASLPGATYTSLPAAAGAGSGGSRGDDDSGFGSDAYDPEWGGDVDGLLSSPMESEGQEAIIDLTSGPETALTGADTEGAGTNGEGKEGMATVLGESSASAGSTATEGRLDAGLTVQAKGAGTAEPSGPGRGTLPPAGPSVSPTSASVPQSADGVSRPCASPPVSDLASVIGSQRRRPHLPTEAILSTVWRGNVSLDGSTESLDVEVSYLGGMGRMRMLLSAGHSPLRLHVKGQVRLSRLETFFEELRSSRSRTVTLGLVRPRPGLQMASADVVRELAVIGGGGGSAADTGGLRDKVGLATPVTGVEAYFIGGGNGLPTRLLKSAAAAAAAAGDHAAAAMPTALEKHELLVAVVHPKEWEPPAHLLMSHDPSHPLEHLRQVHQHPHHHPQHPHPHLQQQQHGPPPALLHEGAHPAAGQPSPYSPTRPGGPIQAPNSHLSHGSQMVHHRVFDSALPPPPPPPPGMSGISVSHQTGTAPPLLSIHADSGGPVPRSASPLAPSTGLPPVHMGSQPTAGADGGPPVTPPHVGSDDIAQLIPEDLSSVLALIPSPTQLRAATAAGDAAGGSSAAGSATTTLTDDELSALSTILGVPCGSAPAHHTPPAMMPAGVHSLPPPVGGEAARGFLPPRLGPPQQQQQHPDQHQPMAAEEPYNPMALHPHGIPMHSFQGGSGENGQTPPAQRPPYGDMPPPGQAPGGYIPAPGYQLPPPGHGDGSAPHPSQHMQGPMPSPYAPPPYHHPYPQHPQQGPSQGGPPGPGSAPPLLSISGEGRDVPLPYHPSSGQRPYAQGPGPMLSQHQPPPMQQQQMQQQQPPFQGQPERGGPYLNQPGGYEPSFRPGSGAGERLPPPGRMGGQEGYMGEPPGRRDAWDEGPGGPRREGRFHPPHRPPPPQEHFQDFERGGHFQGGAPPPPYVYDGPQGGPPPPAGPLGKGYGHSGGGNRPPPYSGGDYAPPPPPPPLTAPPLLQPSGMRGGGGGGGGYFGGGGLRPVDNRGDYPMEEPGMGPGPGPYAMEGPPDMYGAPGPEGPGPYRGGGRGGYRGGTPSGGGRWSGRRGRSGFGPDQGPGMGPPPGIYREDGGGRGGYGQSPYRGGRGGRSIRFQ